jgi:hypothetical protein
MSRPRVTVLGTCRVYDPFKILAEQGVVELSNAGVYGFVHYAKESLQQLRVMHGELAIPLSLKPYITHKAIPTGADDTLATPEYHLSETDLLVVEISSLKEIEFDGFYLQINRVRNQLVGEDEERKRWWKRLYDKEPEDQVSLDRAEFLDDDLSPIERDLILRLTVQIQTEASMLRDMERIKSYFDGPILWVSHFDTKTLAGKEIPIRKQLVRSVEAGAANVDQRFFNPRTTVERFGLAEALEDMAHYTPAFQQLLAERFEALMGEAFPALFQQASSTDRPDPAALRQMRQEGLDPVGEGMGGD